MTVACFRQEFKETAKRSHHALERTKPTDMMLHQRIAIDKTYGWFGEKVDLKQFLEAGRVETYEN